MPQSVSIPALMHEALVPGMQMATIADGRINTTLAFGVIRAGTDAAVTSQTVFEAASLGKPVFAYGVLKLASEGRIHLDTPVGRYLPELEAAVAGLTPRQLLSHSGGLSNGGSMLEVRTAEVGRFSYSGDGFGLLQRVVEAKTQQPLDEYMRAAVFEPLGMASSSYVWRDDFRNSKAFGHGFTGADAGRDHIPVARAQSSLETTAGDYARFMLAMLRGDGLSPEISRQVFAEQVRLERGCIECLGRPRGELSQNMSWGLGWGLEQTSHGTFAWHWGDNNTMQSYAALALDGSRGVVILANSANGHSIMRAVAPQTLGIGAPGYSWLNVYAPYTDPARQLLAQVVHEGVDAMSRSQLALTRTDLLQVAERLMEGRKAIDAVSLLRRLPGGVQNARERILLAEAERRAGDLAAARREAEAALRLDPADGRARDVLNKVEMAMRSVPEALLDRFAGRYGTPFGPLQVSRAGARIVAEFEDQPVSEILAISDHEFLIESVGLPIAFVQDQHGRVTHAIVQADAPVRLPRLDP